MLTRHRSLTEASQVLRQIHIPKKTSRAVRPPPFPSSPPTPLPLPAAPPPLPLPPHCLQFKPKVSELISDLLFLQSKSKGQVSPEKPAAAEPQKQEVQGVSRSLMSLLLQVSYPSS